MVFDGRVGCVATRIDITNMPMIMFINAPAQVIIILCHTGLFVNAFSSCDSESSPSMLTKPPIGSARSEYFIPDFLDFFETSVGPMPIANSSMVTLNSLAMVK